jgi:cyanophycinase
MNKADHQTDAGARAAAHRRLGSLLIIGGGEDRDDDKAVLERFVQLSGGPESKIVVVTAASTVPDKVWVQYDRAFADLGVSGHEALHVDSRVAANSDEVEAAILGADGIYIAGGDQKRLLAVTGGTRFDAALHIALQRGACVAGTSAGASAMSAHMLASGRADLTPEKGAIGLGAGYGFLHRVVIDQHFSERQRLARLLSIIAQNPNLIGVGIDEDTALQVEFDGAIEVLGAGTVTIVDGRSVTSNVADIPNHHCPEMIDVRLHLLPSGSRYDATSAVDDADNAAPSAITEFIQLITKIA